jgi:hypothetical protein
MLPEPVTTKAAPAPEIVAPFAGAQPNELDRRRIVRNLVTRRRYRYVSPVVHAIKRGYLIESPCCSRRVDPEGGIVDVAWLEHVPGRELPWNLYRKDHANRRWELHGTYARLQDMLELLNLDPQRQFWQ